MTVRKLWGNSPLISDVYYLVVYYVMGFARLCTLGYPSELHASAYLGSGTSYAWNAYLGGRGKYAHSHIPVDMG